MDGVGDDGEEGDALTAQEPGLESAGNEGSRERGQGVEEGRGLEGVRGR